MSVAIYNSTNIEYLKHVNWNYSQYETPPYCVALKKTQDAVDGSVALIFNTIKNGLNYINSLVVDYTGYDLNEFYHSNCKKFEPFIESEKFLKLYKEILNTLEPFDVGLRFLLEGSKLSQPEMELIYFVIKHLDIPIHAVNFKADDSSMYSVDSCLAFIIITKIADKQTEVEAAMTDWINIVRYVETETKITSLIEMQKTFMHYTDAIPEEVVARLRKKLGFI